MDGLYARDTIFGLKEFFAVAWGSWFQQWTFFLMVVKRRLVHIKQYQYHSCIPTRLVAGWKDWTRSWLMRRAMRPFCFWGHGYWLHCFREHVLFGHPPSAFLKKLDAALVNIDHLIIWIIMTMMQYAPLSVTFESLGILWYPDFVLHQSIHVTPSFWCVCTVVPLEWFFLSLYIDMYSILIVVTHTNIHYLSLYIYYIYIVMLNVYEGI